MHNSSCVVTELYIVRQENWELKGKLFRAGEFSHPNMSELGQVREEVECEKKGNKNQTLKAQGAAGAHTWKGEKERLVWGQRVQNGWSNNVRRRRGESRSWSHLVGLGVLCTPC